MKIFLANLEEVFRDAAANWILAAYFVLTTIFVLLFATAVNLDVVNGALAGARLFGKDLQMHHGAEIKIEDVVSGMESVASGAIYLFGVLLGLLATAHLVPRMMDKGTVDLYLSRPVGRVPLLLSRYVAGLILVATNLIYLFGSFQIMVASKTHIFHARLWLAALTIFFTIAVLMAFMFLIGTLSSSTIVSLMAGFAVYVFGGILAAHQQISAAVSSTWAANLIDGLYWILPKTGELSKATVFFVAGNTIPDRGPQHFIPVFLTTAVFGLTALTLAAWRFHRRDF